MRKIVAVERGKRSSVGYKQEDLSRRSHRFTGSSLMEYKPSIRELHGPHRLEFVLFFVKGVGANGTDLLQSCMRKIRIENQIK